MYIYSLLALALTAFLAPAVHTKTPLQCLGLAWFYLFDSIVNLVYTAAFGMTWFSTISKHDHRGSYKIHPRTPDAKERAFGHSFINDTVRDGIAKPEGFQSLLFVVALWTVRGYFVFVMLAFARLCIRQYNRFAQEATTASRAISPRSSPTTGLSIHTGFTDPELGGGPNTVDMLVNNGGDQPDWKNRLYQFLLCLGGSYFISSGAQYDELLSAINIIDQPGRSRWCSPQFKSRHSSSTDSSFQPFLASFPNTPTSARSSPTSTDKGGLFERERRRRSGTGPPLPSQTATSHAISRSGNGGVSGDQSPLHEKMYEV